MLSLNTNISSLGVQRNMQAIQSKLQASMQKLSTGNRINSAADDAAGLAIATRMDSQIRGMVVAQRNANDGISLAQTADGALTNVQASLSRMRELAVQASNATNNAGDRTNLDNEYQALSSELQRTLSNTDFNGTKILAGGAGALSFQVGAGNTANDRITVTTTNMSTDANITAVTGGDLTSAANAQTAITNLDNALDKVSSERSTYGATMDRFSQVIDNLSTSSENMQAARGRIMDTDYASEMSNMAKLQIQQQAATAMLAQANQSQQSVLSLLRG